MYVLYQESEPQVQFAGQVQLEGALAQVAGVLHVPVVAHEPHHADKRF